MKNYKKLTSVYLAITIFFAVASAAAQTTAFNFQGRLNDGSFPANGHYDLEFRLYDALTGDNQIGAAISKPNLTLVNGVFSTQLDFGSTAFDGSDRFLEIRLRATGSGNGFLILGPRQQILSVPYTITAKNFTNSLSGDVTGGQNATVVSTVGGQTASSVASGTLAANNATTLNTANSIVKRDIFGDFSAGTITANLNGNATSATNATNAQTAINSQQLGGVAASQYVQLGAPGTVKAMAVVQNVSTVVLTNFQIVTCYNSTLSGSAATTPPCGFSVNRFTSGGFAFNFGFDVWDRPISLATTVRSEQCGYPPADCYYNTGIYYRFPDDDNHSAIDIRTYKSDDSETTTDPVQRFQARGGFSVIVY